MTSATLEQVKAKLSTYVAQAQSEGPVVITRNGTTVAVIIAPTDEEDLESLLLARSPKFVAMIERSRRSAREGKAIPAAAFWEQAQERTRERERASKKPPRRTRASRS